MTVYNINLGIGWANSGVEYAQLYRSKIFQQMQQPAKFIFLDFISSDNIEHLTHNLGFRDEDVIWLYQYFTDIKIAPTTYRTDDLEQTFAHDFDRVERTDNFVRYYFDAAEEMVTGYFGTKNKAVIERAEFVSKGKLIRKDFFTTTRLFSEYYAPRDDRAYLYERHYFNNDGSVAYEELIDGDQVMYRFKDRILYHHTELVAYLLQSLGLTSQDVIILDRETGVGSTVFKNKGQAKLGVVVHAEHFSENYTNQHHILWNNFYEYQFTQASHVDFFITATAAQKKVLDRHFKKYLGQKPKVVEIPVGNLAALRQPEKPRRHHSLLTASRLAPEKHVDWLAKAVVKVQQVIPDVTFDIYGNGAEGDKIRQVISDNHAEAYIQLKGHADMTAIYENYAAYISASTSEGFGLTLMEAVGSGLPIIGFDVPYGNQNFILPDKNGYLVEYNEAQAIEDYTDGLAQAIIKLLEQPDLTAFSQASYQLAEKYLNSAVQATWRKALAEVTHD